MAQPVEALYVTNRYCGFTPPDEVAVKVIKELTGCGNVLLAVKLVTTGVPTDTVKKPLDVYAS